MATALKLTAAGRPRRCTTNGVPPVCGASAATTPRPLVRRPGSPASALRRPASAGAIRGALGPVGARPASASARLTGSAPAAAAPAAAPAFAPATAPAAAPAAAPTAAPAAASGRQARLDLAAAAGAVSLSRVNISRHDADRQPAAPAACIGVGRRPSPPTAAPAAAAPASAATPPPVSSDEAAFLAAPDAAEPRTAKVSMPP